MSGCASSIHSPQQPYQVHSGSGYSSWAEIDRERTISQHDVERISGAIRRETSHYASQDWARVAHSFYIVHFADENTHGLSEEGRVFVSVNHAEDEVRLRKLIHHAIGHNFFRNDAIFTDSDLGKRARSQFDSLYDRSISNYFDRQGVSLEVANTHPRGGVFETSPELLSQGLLSNYSLESAHEHFAVYAESLFTGTLPDGSDFWTAYEKYPQIQEVTDLVVSIYRENHPAYSIDFFRSLSK